MTCKLIRIQKEYKGSDGKIHKGNDYYIEFENGEYIAIMPKWVKQSNDFVRLRAFSELREGR